MAWKDRLLDRERDSISSLLCRHSPPLVLFLGHSLFLSYMGCCAVHSTFFLVPALFCEIRGELLPFSAHTICACVCLILFSHRQDLYKMGVWDLPIPISLQEIGERNMMEVCRVTDSGLPSLPSLSFSLCASCTLCLHPLPLAACIYTYLLPTTSPLPTTLLLIL